MAALAGVVASVAFVAAPQLMVALNGATGGTSGSGNQTLLAVRAPAADPAISVVAQRTPAVVGTVAAQADVMLRDPDIDDYLLAHQRFFSIRVQHSAIRAFGHVRNRYRKKIIYAADTSLASVCRRLVQFHRIFQHRPKIATHSPRSGKHNCG
ncbi:hypothetical protein ACFS07_16805 [Undibacterium arcticum]